MLEKIKAILILEILRRPTDFVKQTLLEMIDKLGKEKEVKIISKTIAEPKTIEEGVFSSFAEVEIETTMQTLMMLIFAYMPSHMDIITPEELRIKNSDLNMFFNELIRKLHQYDEVAKAMIIERETFVRRLKMQGIQNAKETPDNKKDRNKKKKEKRISS